MPTQLFEMMLTKLKRILYCAPSCAKAYDQAHQHFTDNMKWMSVPGIKMIQPFQHVH
jgi:putative component of membrane protein insertase Oxa1/YidC/SpoIIIJ protein YidD